LSGYFACEQPPFSDPAVADGVARMSVFTEIGDPDVVGATVAKILLRMPRVTGQRIEVGGFAL
jgi:hypothetical protein